MQRQKMIILILVVLLVIAIAITAYIVFVKGEENSNSNTNQVNQNRSVVTNTTTNSGTNQIELTEEEKQRNEAARIATIFTERFGTYTGALSKENVEGLKTLLTPALYTSLKNQSGPSGQGDVITTRVLSAALESFTINKTTVAKVQTLRTNATQSQSLSQELTLRLEKSGGTWIVNSVQWGVAKSTDSL